MEAVWGNNLTTPSSFSGFTFLIKSLGQYFGYTTQEIIDSDSGFCASEGCPVYVWWRSLAQYVTPSVRSTKLSFHQHHLPRLSNPSRLQSGGVKNFYRHLLYTLYTRSSASLSQASAFTMRACSALVAMVYIPYPYPHPRLRYERD